MLAALMPSAVNDASVLVDQLAGGNNGASKTGSCLTITRTPLVTRRLFLNFFNSRTQSTRASTSHPTMSHSDLVSLLQSYIRDVTEVALANDGG